jgi:cytochrome c-type biogenesis protein CcsB
MMKRVLNKIFSMSLMSLALLLFFIAIAVATFVENDFGTPVAQKMIYQAFWFELIIGYLSFTLMYNIYRYKLVQRKKLGSLVFHIAFLVIVLGALFTRVVGFEGAMLIREGASSDILISSDTYIQIKVHDKKQQYVYDMPIIIDGHTNNDFKHTFHFPGQSESIELSFVGLIEQAKDTLIPTAEKFGDPYLEIVTVGDKGRKYNYIKSGESLSDDLLPIGFNIEEEGGIYVVDTDSGLFIRPNAPMTYFQMADQTTGVFTADSLQRFVKKRLYTINDQQFVFNAYYKGAKFETIESPSVAKDYKAVTLLAKQGELSNEFVTKGSKGMVPNHTKFKMGDLYYEIAYGSKQIKLPFLVHLNDFELERYPGTENPSSYSSKVTVLDLENEVEKPHHIYMNNVLDYGGYRFFQSSYDEDEKGTILSVNHDALGTNVTYLGYLLLGLGFVISLMQREGRFRLLLRKAKETRMKREAMHLFLIGCLSIFGTVNGYAQDSLNHASHDHDHNHEHVQESTTGQPKTSPLERDQAIELPIIDATHAAKFGHLIIQANNGRFQPVHTLATDVLKKVSRQSNYNGLTPMQVFLGIHTNVLDWNIEPMIYVSGDEVRKKLGIEGSRAALKDFFAGENLDYILEHDAEVARLKKPAARNVYDKDILKTDERLNILLGMFTGSYLKIIPLPNDSANNWYSPYDREHPFTGKDAEFFQNIIPLYNMSVDEAYKTGDWSQADEVVNLLDKYQRKVSKEEIIPSKKAVEWEIVYNKLDVFKHLGNYYLMIGFVLLILVFIQLFNPAMNLKWVTVPSFILFLLMFALHGFGLGLRWYLSGHAPWSNGYEAVVFIAFITVLAGLLFYKQSKIVLGATGILAWLMLFVAHMNALDPEITNLVPVLKSYWLMIHVAIITGSYGFLGLGAILALITLVINLFLTQDNKKHVLLTTKEVTYITEMTLIIGLFMLTIGTFLGGVWANESWGRYWGWDAKETWALASVLVYAIILHFRFVPGLKGQFAFNVAALWGYGSIIMTFFGVNFYLSGLHSYATGDPIPIPTWVPITIVLLLILSIASGLRKRSVIRK